MENKNLLPSIKKDGFLNKIKMIFKSMFYKQPKLIQDSEETIEQINEDSIDLGFKESLKVERDNEKASREKALELIVEKIEKNPQQLNELTIEQLEDVNEFYAQKIQKVNQEIDNLKK